MMKSFFVKRIVRVYCFKLEKISRLRAEVSASCVDITSNTKSADIKICGFVSIFSADTTQSFLCIRFSGFVVDDYTICDHL